MSLKGLEIFSARRVQNKGERKYCLNVIESECAEVCKVIRRKGVIPTSVYK